MKKVKLTTWYATIFTLAIVGLFGIVWAENEATFDLSSDQLHIPKVLVGSDYYEVDMKRTGGANFTITNAKPAASSGSYSVVGSWGQGYWAQGTENTGESEYVSLTFYPNGYYIHYETGQTGEPCDNGGGVEYGTYVFDPSTGTLTITALVDENGCVGLSENGNPSTLTLTFSNEDQFVISGGATSFDRVQ